MEHYWRLNEIASDNISDVYSCTGCGLKIYVPKGVSLNAYFACSLSKSECAAKPHVTKEDAVNHPSHYTQGGIECIDALAAATTNLKGIEAVYTANAIKYLWRWKEKNGITDLKKAVWYINHLIKLQEVNNESKHD